MMTSSPALSVARNALNRTCLPPVEAMIWSVPYSSSFSRLNFAEIAFFSAAVPPMSVYLVSPASIARGVGW